MFLLSFSYQLCLLGLYVTSNVVKLMFIAYFSLLSLTMMVFSACVNNTVHLLCIASEAGKILIQQPYHQHWSSSGLCSLPTALLSLHQRLHI